MRMGLIEQIMGDSVAIHHVERGFEDNGQSPVTGNLL